jgi:hypothetical protein
MKPNDRYLNSLCVKLKSTCSNEDIHLRFVAEYMIVDQLAFLGIEVSPLEVYALTVESATLPIIPSANEMLRKVGVQVSAFSAAEASCVYDILHSQSLQVSN